ANIEAQDARAEQALFAYRKTVLAALEEVETVLTAFVKDQEQLHSLTIAKQAVDEAARLADDRYRAGIVDVFAVLDAQRAVVAVEDQLAQARGAVAKDLARLFKALGGGWRLMETGGSLNGLNKEIYRFFR
ncbi:MAG TPA: TolC family protein, partial [Anaerolineae bacterium]|nr:TolC family protein [Anaerolineae bacterium]